MSLTLLAAMAKSKSPEFFVEKFLLPALRTRKLPDAEMALTGGKPPKGLTKFKENLGKGDYAQITFVDRENPRKVCYLTINIKEFDNINQAPNRRQPLPLAKVFKRPLFKLSTADFNSAIEKTGEARDEIRGIVPKTFRSILIPKKLIDHGTWSANLRESTASLRSKAIDVLLDSNVFSKLEAHEKVELFLHEYMVSIMHAGGKLNNWIMLTN